MIRTVVLDVGETLTHDDRHWGDWADWLGVPRHTLSAPVGTVVVDGRDNADAIRLLRPNVDAAAEYAARRQPAAANGSTRATCTKTSAPPCPPSSPWACASSSPATRAPRPETCCAP
ncbi:hypothetical protein Slala03_27680 [Streptomyces lavendulae subsp. lavendulae]|nr:hypothetical protein Slala03_27680 [Streptomyces lavendulae subsp. lavendulae]